MMIVLNLNEAKEQFIMNIPRGGNNMIDPKITQKSQESKKS
jgi:hypothetical protein